MIAEFYLKMFNFVMKCQNFVLVNFNRHSFKSSKRKASKEKLSRLVACGHTYGKIIWIINTEGLIVGGTILKHLTLVQASAVDKQMLSGCLLTAPPLSQLT